ncbi:MAG: DegT/DnrJ/EryC1/StrS family aminotransferase [Deferrisomatales bacterium]|nr:DegT/DnrJ/EryC1/StrS family aminotransferase [Deferrisomatales bacterium]
MDKRSVGDLTVFGGCAPLFGESVHVGRPNIGDRDALLARIGEVLDRRWLTNNGPLVQELERRLAEYLGVRHVIAVCNGTVALELAIRAVGMAGEVIVPSFTFVATAHALFWQQITPVFCDVDPRTHNLDPTRVEELVTPRTTGIIGVHLWGRPCEVELLAEIAHRRRLRLLYDAAHAFGCSRGGKMVGCFGDAEVFSFHATKFFNTFEGGAIATDDDDLAEKIRLMKNFGFAGYDRVIYIGTNGKMSEVSAAMGLTSLESLGEVIEANRANYHAYRAALGGVPGLRMVEYDGTERCNYQYAVFELDPVRAGLTRDDLVRVLMAENVLARRYFHPGCHRMEPYRSYFPHAGLLLRHTEFLAERVFALPTGPSVDARTLEGICSLVRLACEHGPEVGRRLGSLAP